MLNLYCFKPWCNCIGKCYVIISIDIRVEIVKLWNMFSITGPLLISSGPQFGFKNQQIWQEWPILFLLLRVKERQVWASKCARAKQREEGKRWVISRSSLSLTSIVSALPKFSKEFLLKEDSTKITSCVCFAWISTKLHSINSLAFVVLFIACLLHNVMSAIIMCGTRYSIREEEVWVLQSLFRCDKQHHVLNRQVWTKSRMLVSHFIVKSINIYLAL